MLFIYCPNYLILLNIVALTQHWASIPYLWLLSDEVSYCPVKSELADILLVVVFVGAVCKHFKVQ